MNKSSIWFVVEATLFRGSKVISP